MLCLRAETELATAVKMSIIVRWIALSVGIISVRKSGMKISAIAPKIVVSAVMGYVPPGKAVRGPMPAR